jgi:EmrB/QacA subfamily drug resistance transporter
VLRGSELDAPQISKKQHASEQTPEAAVKIAGLERKWWVLIAVGVGTFMTALDGSVVNTVLPVISRTFGTNVAAVEWIVTVYLLVLSGLLLSFGRLGDMRGHKGVYVAGFGLFVIGSALCGIAPSVPALIAFRGAQALGGAMLAANAPAILTGNFPASQRGRALGLQATMTYLGLTTGPSLGGWLTSQFGWRTVFYINVPVGLLAVALSMTLIPRDRPAERAGHFDLAGAITFMAGLVALLLVLNQGGEWGWASVPIVTLLLAAALFLAVFIAIERRVQSPMLDLSLFRVRLFSASVGSAVLNYICLYSIVFVMPFYLIVGRGLSPAQAGLFLTAQPLVMAIAAPLSGALSDRIGSRLLSTGGMLILSGGLLLLSHLGPDTSAAYIAISLAIAGLGTGIFISPNTSALMGSAPRQRQGIASGILATARNMGMVLGVGLAGAIYTSLLKIGGSSGAAAVASAAGAALLAACAVALLGALASALRGS